MSAKQRTAIAAVVFATVMLVNACGGALHGGEPDATADHSTELVDDPHAPKADTDLGDGRFPTVGFEASHETTLEFAPAEVCPLYEPSGRFLLYDDWDPTVLREPEGDTLVGLVTTSESFGLDVILTVTEHTPEEGRIRYVALWDDFEVQRIDITCEEGVTPDSTTVVWAERNAGLHENGTAMVTTFIEAGGVRINADNYARNITSYLTDQ